MNALSPSRALAASLPLILGLGVLLLNASCSPATRAASTSRASAVIGMGEIQNSTAGNAYELIHQMRPHWLRSRGPASIRDPQPVYPVVYLGEMSYGSLEALRGFPTNSLEELRFIDATTATNRFGSGHSGGVIQVILRR